MKLSLFNSFIYSQLINLPTNLVSSFKFFNTNLNLYEYLWAPLFEKYIHLTKILSFFFFFLPPFVTIIVAYFYFYFPFVIIIIKVSNMQV
jgi:hypothetical protein